MPETDLASPFQRKKTIPMQDGMQGRQQNIAKELLPACRNSQMVPSLQGWPKGGLRVAQGKGGFRVAQGWL